MDKILIVRNGLTANQYFRDRLASESGIYILDEEKIKDWFGEVLHELFSIVYQKYHLDVCYEI